jgi:hypothetical protein
VMAILIGAVSAIEAKGQAAAHRLPSNNPY